MTMKNVAKNAFISALFGGLTAFVVALLVVKFALPVVRMNSEGEAVKVFDAIDGVVQEDLVVAAVEEAAPAVVSIIITKDVPVLEQYYEEGAKSPFDGFFGMPSFNIPKYRDTGETEEKQIGGGSGFIVSPDGYIVTNKHVVSQEDVNYTVFLNDGTELEGEVIARDPINDIAVVKIDAMDLPYLGFADSEALKAGQTVIAIGNPLLEFSNSVSVGVISGLGRSIVAGAQGSTWTEKLEGIIQTDAAINPGNSGGPLLNLKGEVVGVNVAVASAENIGFALPGNAVEKVYLSVKEHGKIVRPYLGVRYMPITEKVAEANNLSVDYGALVVRGENVEELAVIPGSPADKAGLLENDIIIEVDGEKLEDGMNLSRIVAEKVAGDVMKLKVLSKGEEKEVEVTLEEVPE